MRNSVVMVIEGILSWTFFGDEEIEFYVKFHKRNSIFEILCVVFGVKHFYFRNRQLCIKKF